MQRIRDLLQTNNIGSVNVHENIDIMKRVVQPSPYNSHGVWDIINDKPRFCTATMPSYPTTTITYYLVHTIIGKTRRNQENGTFLIYYIYKYVTKFRNSCCMQIHAKCVCRFRI